MDAWYFIKWIEKRLGAKDDWEMMRLVGGNDKDHRCDLRGPRYELALSAPRLAGGTLRLNCYS